MLGPEAQAGTIGNSNPRCSSYFTAVKWQRGNTIGNTICNTIGNAIGNNKYVKILKIYKKINICERGLGDS